LAPRQSSRKKIDVYWRPGLEILGGYHTKYHTKHHTTQYHKTMRQFILHQANGLNVLRWCFKLLQPISTHTQTHINPSGYKEPHSCVLRWQVHFCTLTEQIQINQKFSKDMFNSNVPKLSSLISASDCASKLELTCISLSFAIQLDPNIPTHTPPINISAWLFCNFSKFFCSRLVLPPWFI
jgi:hypothetical protein